MTCLHWDLLYTTKHTHEVFWCLLTLNWTSCLMAVNAVAKVGHFFHNSSKGNTVGTSVHTQQSPAALAVRAAFEPIASLLSCFIHDWVMVHVVDLLDCAQHVVPIWVWNVQLIPSCSPCSQHSCSRDMMSTSSWSALAYYWDLCGCYHQWSVSCLSPLSECE